MDNTLQEQKPRGTPLFPLQLYRTENSGGDVFIPYHWHSETELIFVLEGSVNLSVNEKSFSGTAGDIFWIASESLHQIGTEGRPTRYGALLFPMEFLSFGELDEVQHRYLSPLCRNEKHFPTKIPRESPHYRHAWSELTEIDRLDQKRGAAYRFLLKASLLKFIGLLSADGLLQSDDSCGDRFSACKLNSLKAVLSYIGSRCGEKLSLSDAASAFGLSPKYFSRYFKKNFNCSFVDYLTGFRLDRAVDLLLSTDLPVSEIAPAVGFDNLSYFIKRFKKARGCTPLQFRKLGSLPADYHQLHPPIPGGRP